ncbi:unnamed protein product [Rotaria magnacalcarata]|uniref:Phosphatidylinositol transfer protein N-terminal domain-containing protein n=1 Tax=Rotaria magnacalcarata TaxID=392030 RepID=A0A819WTI2_9BILA|nr:unnamed protein product [Rotaria magnacalcarata]CAF1477090.1 unnamed protein product [Rotaria magnacalcarata]CAF1937055.1 unnamed protein product [Rotaria magnacalcarata]CAF2088834.1 unnamed protein product [Rotaria magnacalcarata]CAF2243973.1 unnamed protein product [Rotaria magnacalcarata]
MHITEFRIVLPMTVEEYQIAQLFSTAKVSEQNTGGGEGVEVLANEPFAKPPSEGFLGRYNVGQYTRKVYHFASRVPGFVRLVFKESNLSMHEEAWNAYPYCKTVITNPYMKENMLIEISTLHLGDRGDTENVHQLNHDELKKRHVVYIYISDKVSRHDYKAEEDPEKFHSSKTGRGPLVSNDQWYKTCEPYMCCYKLVRAKFKWLGIQTRVENLIMTQEDRLFRNFHRQLFCWMDEWYGLTMQDIRALEAATAQKLEKARQAGQKQGYTAEE